jgi:hypothetical protein
MATRLSDVIWRSSLLLGSGAWIALLPLAHRAGPADQALFWATLIAALPIGFGWIFRRTLSGKTGLDGTGERGCRSSTRMDDSSDGRAARTPALRIVQIFNPAAPSQKRVMALDNRGSVKAYVGRRQESTAVKARPVFKLNRKSTEAVPRAKKKTVTKVNAKRRQRAPAGRRRARSGLPSNLTARESIEHGGG